MSTLTSANGRAVGDKTTEEDRDQTVPSRLSLPTFQSVRDPSTERNGEGSKAASTASGSTSHKSDRRTPEPEHDGLLERLSFHGSSAKSDRSREKEKENDAPRHNISRTSGGFLLESITNLKRFSRSNPTPARNASGKKRQGGESELMVTKKRQRANGRSSTSFRSSPLASEVKDDAAAQNSSSPTPLNVGADDRRSFSSSPNESRFTGSSVTTSRNLDAQRSRLGKVGFDNDPAQIVNMALTLSEGRRKLASGRRYASTEQGDRRVISGASTLNPSNTVRKRSIAPFMSAQRQSSQSGSPGRKSLAKNREASVPVLKSSTEASVTELEDDEDFDVNFVNHISAATMARVEKAKMYFELAHEHRRLLPHLPPLRTPGTPAQSAGPEALQKAYNPLQYVRNRKLRIWEKAAIDSEADGWHDIPKVRAWVDAVTSSHAETQHDSLECVRLPPLDLRTADTDGEESDDSPDEPKKILPPRMPDQPHPKPSRPRSDWVTHPADLIADAFWLEQGLNKTKIQDRDNTLIYPPNTHFRFSGWRKHTPVIEIPSRLQQPSPPPDSPIDSFQEPPASALPELPTFKSAHNGPQKKRPDRRRNIIRDSLQPKEDGSSRERSRIRKKLFQDSSGSDFSGMSSDETRGRKRLRGKKNDASKNGDLGKHGSNSQSKQSLQIHALAQGDSSQGSSAPTSKRGSVDHSALNKLFFVDSFKKVTPLARSRNRQDTSRAHSSAPVPIRRSLDQDRPGRPSTEYDTTTAPNSPTNSGWPSIAINLSPPPSRPTSPERKPLSTVLNPFQRKPHKAQSSISTTDFASVPPSRSSLEAPGHIDHTDSRGHSPMTRGVSPLSRHRTQTTEPDELAPQWSNEHRHSTASKVSTRSAGPTGPTGGDHSRLRGMFKGGRIAEIVGNEVSRVGDFIWKRDPPVPRRRRGSASDGSTRSYGSDTEDDHHRHQQNGTVFKTPPQDPRSRSSTLESVAPDQASHTTKDHPKSNRPQLNNPNLPNFTSPFQKDRDKVDKKQGLLGPEDASIRVDSTDNIPNLNSRSPRLAQLPKLDTGPPNADNDLSRQNTYGFGDALDHSRSRDASDQLNSVSGPVTGLSRLRPTKSAGDISGSDAGMEDRETGDVKIRDIERAYALLFSSTVKAREIGRRADDAEQGMPAYLFESLTSENKALHTTSPMKIRRRDRHVVAAQNIMKTLEMHSTTFNQKIHSFTRSRIPGLHTQLQTLEDQVENSMTPQVRVTADSAGELSMKLATTSTLAVKELNDTIERAFRHKRRGPIRVFRKAWFAGMEWTVVGLLWLIWAVVSVIQSILGMGRGMIRGVRWLLWID